MRYDKASEAKEKKEKKRKKKSRCTKVNNKCIIKRWEPGTEEKRKNHVGVARLRIPGSWKVPNESERGRMICNVGVRDIPRVGWAGVRDSMRTCTGADWERREKNANDGWGRYTDDNVREGA